MSQQKLVQNKPFGKEYGIQFWTLHNGNGKVRDSVVKAVRKSFMNSTGFLEEIKCNHISEIVVEKRSKRSTNLGMWSPYYSRLTIYDSDDIEVKEYEQTVIHELSHVWYDHKSDTNPKAILKFAKTINKLFPISRYSASHKASWGFSLYANEVHSETATIIYDGNVNNFGSKKNFEKVKKAFLTLHKESKSNSDIREYGKSSELSEKDLDKLNDLQFDMVLTFLDQDELQKSHKPIEKIKMAEFPASVESQKQLVRLMIKTCEILGYKVNFVGEWIPRYEDVIDNEDTHAFEDDNLNIRWYTYEEIYKIIKDPANIIPRDLMIKFLMFEGYLVSY